jgi:hypothetical protein
MSERRSKLLHEIRHEKEPGADRTRCGIPLSEVGGTYTARQANCDGCDITRRAEPSHD